MGEFSSFLQNNLADFWTYTGFIMLLQDILS